MSWLSDFVGPRIRDIVGTDRTDEGLRTCAACGRDLSQAVFEAGLGICPACGHPNPLRPVERFATVFDDGRFEVVDVSEANVDVLHFRDLRRYAERLKEAHLRAGGRDALAVGRGMIGGNDAVVACADEGFLGGTLGIAAVAAFAQAARLATLQRAPLVVFTGAHGPRIQEGLFALAQSTQVRPIIADLNKAGMPCIVVIVAARGDRGLPAFAGFADILVREIVRADDPGEETGVDPSAANGSAVDVVVRRQDLAAVLTELADLTVDRRASAPVLPLHPTAADTASADAAGIPEDAPAAADQASER